VNQGVQEKVQSVEVKADKDRAIFGEIREKLSRLGKLIISVTSVQEGIPVANASQSVKPYISEMKEAILPIKIGNEKEAAAKVQEVSDKFEKFKLVLKFWVQDLNEMVNVVEELRNTLPREEFDRLLVILQNISNELDKMLSLK